MMLVAESAVGARAGEDLRDVKEGSRTSNEGRVNGTPRETEDMFA